MRGRTNILARPYPIINCDVEEFIAEEDIEIGSFVEPIYETNVNDDFFRSYDLERKILRVVGNYFLIAFIDGVKQNSAKDLYNIGVFEFSGGTFIPCANVISTGLSLVGGLVNYSDNVYLICGGEYNNQSNARICKFYVDMETFKIYDYENSFVISIESYIRSNNLFIVDNKIEFVFFYSYDYTNTNSSKTRIAVVCKIVFDNINDFTSYLKEINRYDSGVISSTSDTCSVKISTYNDDLIRVGDSQYVICTYHTDVWSGTKRYYRSVCLFDFNDFQSNGQINVKTLSNDYYIKNTSNLMIPIMIDKKNFIWTYGGGKVYKGGELIKIISQLNFGTSSSGYKCAGCYVEDGLCILFLNCDDSSSSQWYPPKAFVLEYNEILDSITFSNEISNEKIYFANQCVKVSDDNYLLFQTKGWMIVNYKDGILTEGEVTNKVKPYTSNSKVIGFTKNGGSAGDVIQVYVPKDKS